MKSNRQIWSALSALFLTISAAQSDDWPQWLGPQRDGVWRETGILEVFPSDGPTVLWRVPVGAGYSGPAVANGRVYLTDRHLMPGAQNPDNPFSRSQIAGTERVLCLDEKSGKILWQHQYDCPYTVSYPAGPRATPLVGDGKVYTLGAEGNLICLDAVTGKILWSRDFKKDFNIPTPIWGFAAHPLLDGQRLICLVGGNGSAAVAFDKDSGQEIWRALTAKEPGYCPPMIYEFGGRRQLIVWHPESINALEPETGRLLWSEPFTVRSGLSIPTPRQDGDRLLITSFYNGSRMLRVQDSQPSILWQSKKASEKDTDTLHSIMSTPAIDNGHIYGVCSYGQLRCLKADTGERVWATMEATTGGPEVRWANAFLIKHQDRYFLANEKGDLIIAKLRPAGYQELSRTRLLEPTNREPGRLVVWSHPAFANRSVYARNDKELVCVWLGKPE